jgi:signal peptidase I
MKARKFFIAFILFAVFLFLASAFLTAAYISMISRSSASYTGLHAAAGTPAFLSTSQNECPVRTKETTVTGNSLSGLIAPGQTVTVLLGYYSCHDPQRNDVVIYRYGSASVGESLVKIVKAVPGDAVSLKKVGGSWNILVNGLPLRTTAGIPYALNASVFGTFSYYVDEANGIIPPDSYMLLGNLPAGSIDSTRFGFVKKEDLAGKVVN